MRKSVYAGKFYPGAVTVLDKTIKECFEDKFGPGALPSKPDKKIKAVIVPHAGYKYSGPCAAWAYKELAEMEMPDLFILLGPNHHGNGSGISMETWDMPYGYVRVDQDFARALKEKGNIKVNEKAHAMEHSLEVQIPFIQFIYKNKLEKIKILPVLVDSNADLDKIALDLKETIMDSGKKVVFIVSSDFTHYGRDYRHLPFTSDVKKRIYEQDREAIKFIENFDAEGFLKFTDDNFMTICGVYPIALLLKTIKSKKVRLEQYYTSADILKTDYKNSVSYAAVIFE
ncbi:AmmeMemoRadiSam system protein B [Candidatus Woesearchaeota archaeon]|nr:AmmeMemoRadiSam system protein B [Candidatus Woesearchaeota archaeon]